ncbi:MAG: hypothetical protein ABW321_01695 [Polyangiales bacterium]
MIKLPSKRQLVVIVSTSACALGLVAFAHTPAGRPLLNALRGAPGCPVDLSAGDPAALEAHRIRQLQKTRGTELEHARPALGFTLGSSTREQVLAWSQRAGAHCESSRKSSTLICTRFERRDETAPRLEDVHLQFDESGRLVAVNAFRKVARSADAAAWLTRLDSELTSQVGQATDHYGEATPAFLDVALQRVSRKYRYRNYLAEISAMNYGPRGVMVREEYQWLPPS